MQFYPKLFCYAILFKIVLLCNFTQIHLCSFIWSVMWSILICYHRWSLQVNKSSILAQGSRHFLFKGGSPPKKALSPLLQWLEVNKCAFTFSSEIRQIQCTRTEFWCVQCPRPAGLRALDKHQIQASALDLSYFTSKSKCKFINLIHTRQKSKIICSCSWKIINKMALKCH